MTAAWKQKKFERLAQKDVVEELKNQVRLLQDKITDLKEVNKYREMQMHEVYKQRDEYMILANRYNRLRTEEIMIATPDGFKLVTGAELDIHCGTIEAKTWWGNRGQQMTYTVSADEAVDTWSYARQIQESILYGTSIVKMVKDNDTRSKSKETDQEDS
jgi:hypothetical protein